MEATRRTPAELIRIFYQAMDGPNPALLEDLFTDEAEAHFPGIEVKGNATLIKSALEGMSAAGLRTDHTILHMLEQGDVAICEMRTVNTVNHVEFRVRGAAVCEAQGGRIKRLVTYLDASEMQAFISMLNAANIWLLFQKTDNPPTAAP
jgi:limonene-1,2-epoxide hydrolase